MNNSLQNAEYVLVAIKDVCVYIYIMLEEGGGKKKDATL